MYSFANIGYADVMWSTVSSYCLQSLQLLSVSICNIFVTLYLVCNAWCCYYFTFSFTTTTRDDLLGIFHVGLFPPRYSYLRALFSTFCSFIFKGVYPLSGHMASLSRCMLLVLNLFLIFLSYVLHTLWIFTKPYSSPFWGRYNLILDEVGWRY